MKSFLFKHVVSNIYNLIFSIKLQPRAFKLEKNQRCLVLAAKTEDIFAGLGGTILLNPEKFCVYALTNGFREIIDMNMPYEEKVNIRKKEFDDVTEKTDVSYSEIFTDVDDNRLLMRYDKFKSIVIEHYDYIFVPNILESNRDNKAIAILLNQLLKDRPYKRHLKIVFYEVNSTLPMVNEFVNIENTIDKKVEIIDNISPNIGTEFAQNIKCLNKFRGSNAHKTFAEALCVLDVNEFKTICKTY